MTAKAGRRKSKIPSDGANAVVRNGKHSVSKNAVNGRHSPRNNNDSFAPTLKNGSAKTTKSIWPTIEEEYDGLLHAFYEDEDNALAAEIAGRLAPLLRQADPHRETIFASECWSLIAETRGNLPSAIHHRQKEIAKIEQLWNSARTADQADMFLQFHSPLDLADRYDLLAILYHDSGQLKKAIQALWKSREICEEHGVKFDSTDLLKEYLQELRGPVKAKKRK